LGFAAYWREIMKNVEVVKSVARELFVIATNEKNPEYFTGFTAGLRPVFSIVHDDCVKTVLYTTSKAAADEAERLEHPKGKPIVVMKL
jgi:hypothetical protein